MCPSKVFSIKLSSSWTNRDSWCTDMRAWANWYQLEFQCANFLHLFVSDYARNSSAIYIAYHALFRHSSVHTLAQYVIIADSKMGHLWLVRLVSQQLHFKFWAHQSLVPHHCAGEANMGLFNVSEPYSAITRALAYTIQDCSCCYIHKEIRKDECILNVKQKLILSQVFR